MANKRQKKKQQKRQAQAYLLQQGYTVTEVKHKSYSSLSTLYTKEVKRERRKNRQKERKNRLRKEKFDYLLNQGFDPETIKSSDLNKSWEYIKDYQSKIYDFNKVYKLKDKQRMFLAYRDYAGEQDFEELLQRYSKYSNSELLANLKSLVHTPPQYTGRGKKGSKGRGSSGKAGDYKYQVDTQQNIALWNQEAREENRKKPKRKWQHTGEFKGYQVLKSGRRVSFDEYTPRNLLIIANAIAGNVTEWDRISFYKRFYSDMKYHNPELSKILPEPRF